MNDKRLAAVHYRMAVWFTLWVLAGLCGLPLFDLTTVFWVTVITTVIVNKEK